MTNASIADLAPRPRRAASHALPYARPFVDESDIDAVVRVLKSGQLVSGALSLAFEALLAKTVDARHAIACSSGTAALHLAARALGLGPGDSVIVPAITFLATANAARLAGAEIVFADVDPDTGLMGPEHLQAAIARLPAYGKRALFNVHFAGQCQNPEEIARLARAAGLKIVEDGCHAIGTEYRNEAGRWLKVGSCTHCDLTVFSFHQSKTIVMGEGGAVTTNDPLLAERIRLDRNHGALRDPAHLREPFSQDLGGAVAPWSYEMSEPGFNYRASEIHCALGLSQLQRLKALVRERRTLVNLYDRLLMPLWPVVRPIARPAAVIPAWHLYVVLIDFARLGLTRGEAVAALKSRGIGAQVHYIPVSRQPYYAKRYGAEDLPGAAAYYESCLSLPLFVGMTDDDVARVVEALAAMADR